MEKIISLCGRKGDFPAQRLMLRHIITLSVVSFVLVGCESISQTDLSKSNDLVGTWKLARLSLGSPAHLSEKHFLIFTPDFRLLRLPENAEMPDQFYHVEANHTLTATSPGGRFDPVGTFVLSGETLRIQDEDGSVSLYRRISRETDPRLLDPKQK